MVSLWNVPVVVICGAVTLSSSPPSTALPPPHVLALLRLQMMLPLGEQPVCFYLAQYSGIFQAFVCWV